MALLPPELRLEELNDTAPTDTADVNKDGKLTLDEFQAMMKAESVKPANCAEFASAHPGGAPKKINLF